MSVAEIIRLIMETNQTAYETEELKLDYAAVITPDGKLETIL